MGRGLGMPTLSDSGLEIIELAIPFSSNQQPQDSHQQVQLVRSRQDKYQAKEQDIKQQTPNERTKPIITTG
ncbi:hypothetical protein TNCV_2895561 [Trichonephila clavipes]|nr:hypothetical protein TNCV_2895561 [Trichonephila clavipes]